jgi:hypothetical protein
LGRCNALCTLGRGFGSSDFRLALAARCSAGTTAIGSPPNGSFISIAQPTRTASGRPSAPAIARGTTIGRLRRRFGALCWPSGALRSSVLTAQTLANHAG